MNYLKKIILSLLSGIVVTAIISLVNIIFLILQNSNENYRLIYYGSLYFSNEKISEAGGFKITAGTTGNFYPLIITVLIATIFIFFVDIFYNKLYKGQNS